jgi:membrane protein YdbS with pleckstrin-like domain
MDEIKPKYYLLYGVMFAIIFLLSSAFILMLIEFIQEKNIIFFIYADVALFAIVVIVSIFRINQPYKTEIF